jgi:hypothetical protein
MRLISPAMRRRLLAVLQVGDPPWRIALALAVGVFVSCTPFYGLQTLLAFLIATVSGLSRAVTITGTWINLPWFAPLVYTAAFEIGSRVVPGRQELPGAALAILTRPRGLSLEGLTEVLADLSLVLLVGTTILGLAAGAVTYGVAFAILSRRSRRGSATASSRRAA